MIVGGIPAHDFADRRRAAITDRVAGRERLCRINRTNNFHIRKHAHDRQIFQALRGSAIFTDRDTGVRGHELDIQIVVTDIHPDLVIGAVGQKYRKRISDRDKAFAGQARGYSIKIKRLSGPDISPDRYAGRRAYQTCGRRIVLSH